MAELIRAGQWLEETTAAGEQVSRLFLLDNDVQCAQLALEDYFAARDAPPRAGVIGVDYVAHARLFYSAKSFVCAVRRVGRVLETLPAKRVFPDDLNRALRELWRRKKASFDRFIGARDAIEHIDERAGKKTGGGWVHLNLETGDMLAVTPTERAPITAAALESVLAARDEVVALVRQHLPAPTREERLAALAMRLAALPKP